MAQDDRLEQAVQPAAQLSQVAPLRYFPAVQTHDEPLKVKPETELQLLQVDAPEQSRHPVMLAQLKHEEPLE